jgi:hypothetical protein
MPTTAETWVTDWTEYQGVTLPAEGVVREGFSMVKLKAGGSANKGNWYEDPRFSQNAAALLATDALRAAYWYLTPGRPIAQAGRFLDLFQALPGGLSGWAPFVDVEATGLTWRDFAVFTDAWQALTGGRQLSLYTRKNFWMSNMGEHFDAPALICPVLELSHYVPNSIKFDPAIKYASQQYRAVDPRWWEAGFGGWGEASLLQFTDHCLIQGKWNVASLYRGTKQQLADLLGVTQ